MIAVIDYGMGNIGSIINMFHKIGAEVIATDNVDIINEAEKLVLSGVGSFDNGIRNWSQLGLIAPLKDMVLQDKKLSSGYAVTRKL